MEILNKKKRLGDDPTFCLYLRAFIFCVTLLRTMYMLFSISGLDFIKIEMDFFYK